MLNECHDRNRRRRRPHPATRPPLEFVACSVCLRVLWKGEWLDTEAAIRRFRTFEDPRVVNLGDGICDRCRDELRLRREPDAEALAA
jgi:hypothetical protein